MANTLPFNSAVIGATTISAAEFVSGSGVLTESGKDKAVTTADGRIHNVRQHLSVEAKFECYGDKSSLSSSAGSGSLCSLKKDDTEIKSLEGVVTAVYSDSKKTTSVTISGR